MFRVLSRVSLVVSRLASDKEYKPELTTVLITDNETVATDGKVFAKITRSTPFAKEDFPVIPPTNLSIETIEPTMVKASTIETLLKSMPKCRQVNLPILEKISVNEASKDKITFNFFPKGDLSNNQSINATPISGTYPDYQTTLNRLKPTATVRLDINKLKEVVDCLAAFAKESGELKANWVEMSIGGTLAPVSFTATASDHEILALVSPLKI